MAFLIGTAQQIKVNHNTGKVNHNLQSLNMKLPCRSYFLNVPQMHGTAATLWITSLSNQPPS